MSDKQQIVKSSSSQIETWMNDGKMMERIGSALSGYLEPKTFAAQCVLAAKDKNLADCTPTSLFEAFLVCAQMGLLPGKHHAHVALIPRNDRDTGRKMVDVMPQWQGFKFLMERQPGIRRVTPVLVHTSDVFSWDNATGELIHTFDPFSESRVFLHPSDAKDGHTGLRGGYLKIEHEDGEIRYHFVSASKIEAARKCSQTPDLDKWNKPGVWRKWFPEQCVKTVLRDAWARRAVAIDPTLESRLSETAQADDLALGNDPTRGGHIVDAEAVEPSKPVTAPVAKPSGMDRLRAKVMPKTQPPEPEDASETHCPNCGCTVEPSIAEEVAKAGNCPDCPTVSEEADQPLFQ